MKTNKALQFHNFGAPEEVLQLENLEIPTPGQNQVLLRHHFAPINPSDFGSINGSYGSLKNLPATPGKEGVAEILEIGQGVTGFKPSDTVLIPGNTGSWQQYSLANTSELVSAPQEIPLEQLAMASINPPTAWCLLHEFIKLKPGGWILQNAATSAVGISVIQLAKHLGFKTLNVVRDPNAIDRLKPLGADAVVTEDSEYFKNIPELTYNEPIHLALNSIGGQSAINQIKSLTNKGTQVTFGGMTNEMVRFPTRYLIFNEIQLKGFWLQKHLQEASSEQKQKLYTTIFDLLKKEIIKTPVEKTYPIDQYKEALSHNQKPGKAGKVLFDLTK